MGMGKVYFIMNWCRSQTCLKGKTAIITGGNKGLGYETALDFAKRGAKVILACRDAKKAVEACEKIKCETDNDDVDYETIDLSSFKSVHRFADSFKMKEKRLDILVNNAGILYRGDSVTDDGLQEIYQTNYFSTVLLTYLMLDLLRETKGRIVNVSSVAAWYTIIRLKDLNSFDTFPGEHISYARSKLCQILFTIELAEKLKPTGVTVYSLHPGVIKTKLFAHTNVIMKIVISIARPIFFQNEEEGAQTTIYCSVTKGIENDSGEHFVNCRRVSRYFSANNPKLAKGLWNRTMDILKIDNFIK